MPSSISHIAVFCLAILLIPGCNSLLPPPADPQDDPPATPPRSSNWAIGFTRLRVEDPQEDRQIASFSISNGDEPYLILIGFKSELGVTGSGQIVTNQYQDDEWAENTRAGRIVNIPATMGIFEFRGVTSDTVIGILAITMESDRTPWQVIEDRVQQVISNLQNVIIREVEQRDSPNFNGTEFIDNLHQAMVEAAIPLSTSLSAGQALENLIFSGIDTDEFIGANSIVFMEREPTRALTLPHYSPPHFTDRLEDKDYTLNAFPLVYENNNLRARYISEMKVREF